MTTGNYLNKRLIGFITIMILYSVNTTAISRKTEEKQNTIRIQVYYTDSIQTDSLIFYLANKFYPNQENANNTKIVKKKNAQGFYEFIVPVEADNGYWELRKIKEEGYAGITRAVTISFYWEAGDDIKIYIQHKDHRIGINSTYKIVGKGHEKYVARYKTDSLYRTKKEKTENEYEKYGLQPATYILNTFELIKPFKNRMSDLAYKVLLNDVLFEQGYGFQTQLTSSIRKNKIGVSSLQRDQLIKICEFAISGRGMLNLDSTALSRSTKGIDFLLNTLMAESYIRFDQYNPKWIYETIKLKYKGDLRDNLILSCLINTKQYEKADSIYLDAVKTVKDTECKGELEFLRHLYLSKEFKYAFLKDTLGNDVDLYRFSDKVLVFDFWFTGCPSCSIYYKNVLSKVKAVFSNDKNVLFLSISVDRSMEKWKKSIHANEYTSTSSINLYTGGKGYDHPITKLNAIKIFPTAMIVDRKGKIKYFNTKNLYAYDGLITAIKNLK